MTDHDWICLMVQWKMGWPVWYIYHPSLLLPSIQSMPPSSILLSSLLALVLTEQAQRMHKALCQDLCPPTWMMRYSQAEPTKLREEIRIFTLRNWFHAHVCCRHQRKQSPWTHPTAPSKRALHALHLQAYSMESNKVSFSLGHHKTPSVLCPEHQYGCAQDDESCCCMDAPGAPRVTIFHHCQTRVTTLWCKILFCYFQPGSRHTSKAKLGVSKFSFISLFWIHVLSRTVSPNPAWIGLFHLIPGSNDCQSIERFFESWFLADDHDCYKTVFKNILIFEKNFPFLLYQPHVWGRAWGLPLLGEKKSKTEKG